MFDPVLFAALMSSTAAFTPLSLFAAGEQGAWYDPSDFSTMFQDSAGTTPVTAVEQPVGLIRDKSGRGNHASQSTAASRPVLSARVNQLTYTDGLRATEWGTLSNLTRVVSGGGTPSTGSGNYTRLTATAGNTDHYLQSAGITFVSGVNYTLSFEVQYVDHRWVGLSWFDGGFKQGSTFDLLNGVVGSNLGENSARSITSLGGGRYRISISRTSATSGAVYAGIVLLDSDKLFTTTTTSNLSATIVDIGLVDLRVTNVGVNLPAYQRVAAATDYDTSGFPLYLKFDGVDDSLATGTIDFTATDKMSVFAGHRIVSGTGSQIMCELGTNSFTSSGFAFGQGLAAASSGLGFLMNAGSGIAGQTADKSVPYTSVSSLLLNTAQSGISNEGILRSNTTLQTFTITAGTDSGTANFPNKNLYIGNRSAASVWFNGNLYSFIVRGALSTDAQIASTETYVNNLTKAY